MTLIQKIEQIFPNQEIKAINDKIYIGCDIAIEIEDRTNPIEYNLYLNWIVDPTKRCIICKGDHDLVSILEKID